MLPSITVGDSLSFTTSLADYPAGAGWVLKYRLIPREAGAAIGITCAASGDLHLASVSAATSATWTAGAYGWTSWVERGAESITVAGGSVDLTPNLRVSAGLLDTRSSAAKALAAAEAALAAWTPTTKRYSINGREMEFNSPADIIAVITHWRSEVQRENRAALLSAGKADPRRVFVRLGRA